MNNNMEFTGKGRPTQDNRNSTVDMPPLVFGDGRGRAHFFKWQEVAIAAVMDLHPRSLPDGRLELVPARAFSPCGYEVDMFIDPNLATGASVDWKQSVANLIADCACLPTAERPTVRVSLGSIHGPSLRVIIRPPVDRAHARTRASWFRTAIDLPALPGPRSSRQDPHRLYDN